MNDTTTVPSGKRSPSAAILGNGKPARRNARHIPSTDSPESYMKLILATVVAFRDGDFSARLPTDWDGVEGEIAEAFNQTIARKERILKEVTRLSATVGKEGRLKQRNYENVFAQLARGFVGWLRENGGEEEMLTELR